ncbi:hypothetical protein ACOSP7_008096 [Xanthoceras sorbifolium]
MSELSPSIANEYVHTKGFIFSRFNLCCPKKISRRSMMMSPKHETLSLLTQSRSGWKSLQITLLTKTTASGSDNFELSQTKPRTAELVDSPGPTRLELAQIHTDEP